MSYIQEQEERFSILATDADADREEARNRGRDNPEQAWILTNRDVWHRNTFYTGPAQPHPEDQPAEDFEPPVPDPAITCEDDCPF